MKPVVDPEKCISCGQCAATCPEVFFMGDDGIANVRYEDAEGNATDFSLYEEKIAEAIGGCPNQAISDSEAEDSSEEDMGGDEMIDDSDDGMDMEEAA